MEGDLTGAPESSLKPDDVLELLTVDWTFGTEELSVRSPYLRQMEKEPCLFLSKKDAARLEIFDGDRITVNSNEGTIDVHAAVVENMTSGILVLPRHHRLDWQHLEAPRITLTNDQIYRVKDGK